MVLVATYLSLKPRVRILWESDPSRFMDRYIGIIKSYIRLDLVRELATNIISDCRKYVKDVIYKGLIKAGERKEFNPLLGRDS